MASKDGLAYVKQLADSGDWTYIGGEEPHESDINPVAQDRYYIHHNYYLDKGKVISNDAPTPSHDQQCACNKQIKFNCWVHNKNTNEIMVIGSVCYKKFFEKRHCVKCDEPFSSDIYLVCKECRPALVRFRDERVASNQDCIVCREPLTEQAQSYKAAMCYSCYRRSGWTNPRVDRNLKKFTNLCKKRVKADKERLKALASTQRVSSVTI